MREVRGNFLDVQSKSTGEYQRESELTRFDEIIDRFLAFSRDLVVFVENTRACVLVFILWAIDFEIDDATQQVAVGVFSIPFYDGKPRIGWMDWMDGLDE